MRDWLKLLRTNAGYTMKEMGDKLCISESYYFMIESGERQKKMDLTLAAGIAAIFGIPVTDVVANEQAQSADHGA